MLHSGLEDEAAALAKKMIATFESVNVDTIVINSAGCGSTMKEYGHLLRDDPEWARTGCGFLRQVQRHLRGALRTWSRKRGAIRSSCAWPITMRAICSMPRVCASSRVVCWLVFPELEVAEIPEASLCCGSAGVFNLLQPETASQLGSRKVDNLLTTGADVVVSANPGCLLQLMYGLRRRGLKTMPAFHMVELLDASMRGISREELLLKDR